MLNPISSHFAGIFCIYNYGKDLFIVFKLTVLPDLSINSNTGNVDKLGGILPASVFCKWLWRIVLIFFLKCFAEFAYKFNWVWYFVVWKIINFLNLISLIDSLFGLSVFLPRHIPWNKLACFIQVIKLVGIEFVIFIL